MIHFFRTPFGAIVILSMFVTGIVIYLSDNPYAEESETNLDFAPVDVSNPYAMANNLNRNLLQEYHRLLKDIPSFKDDNDDSITLAERQHRAMVGYYGEILQSRLDRAKHVRELPQATNSAAQTLEDPKAVDWSQYAYVTYATSGDYLCAALMLFAQLRDVHGTKARFALLYPRAWGFPSTDPGQLAREKHDADALAKGHSKQAVKAALEGAHVTRLLRKAKDLFNVELIPVRPLSMRIARQIVEGTHGKENLVLSGDDVGKSTGIWDEDENDDSTWKLSFTKILAFNQTQYKKAIVLDADAFVMHSLDHLFFAETDKQELEKHRVAVDVNPKDEFSIKNGATVLGPSPYWLLSPDHVAHAGDSPERRASTDHIPLEFTSMLEVVTPSTSGFMRLVERLAELDQAHETLQAHEEREVFYDMELVNHVFANVSLPEADPARKHRYLLNRSGQPNSYGVLDHRGLVMLTGELAHKSHEQFFAGHIQGTQRDENSKYSRETEAALLWHPGYAVSTTAYIHFSDWPYPKVSFN